MHRQMKFLLIIPFVWFVFQNAIIAQSSTFFPLRLSDNKRYLIDVNSKPFVVKEFSAWGLIQALSEKDEAAYLDSLKLKGFNTVMTSIISNAPSQMGGNPPYWQGISPFSVQWDFSTPNETYFQHVDRFFKIAEQKGFFVIAVPCYLGYSGDPSQGWWDEMMSPKNDTIKTKKYGEFLGKRYSRTKNILWLAGGDNNAEGKLLAYESNLINGIRSVDTAHLWSGHFDMNHNVIWSTDHPVFGSGMDIDGLYVWTESVLFEKGPQYKTELDHYTNGKMTMQLDLSYEHDVPHFADNENYQWMRRKIYDGLLSGCAGTSFSSGEIGNYSYSFKNWKPLMSTRGMKQAEACFRLFESLPWYKLIPDQTNEIILSGRGAFGSLDYICAARANDSSCYVLYIPKGQSFEINAAKISGKPMRMHWYNPRNGEVLKIGVAETRERYGISPPSEEDWVLVFDDMSFDPLKNLKSKP
jgi:hypothetical protein